MNGISSATDVGLLAAVLYNTSRTSAQIGTLTAQGSSGLISSDYAGLGDAAGAALNLSGQVALNASYQTNANQAATQAQVAQSALGQIQTLVSGFASQLLEPASATQVGLATLATSAGSALQQIASLLNTKVGNTYVFAGQDSRDPPIPDPATLSTSAFATAIQAAVASLDTAGASATQSQILTAAGPGATSPFSATLEASNLPASADIGNSQSVQTSVLADQNANAVSAGTGTTSTGSYTRDILASLATVAALGTSAASDPKVISLLSLTQTTLSNADDALNTDIGSLGARQQSIVSTQSELTETATALTVQLGNLQDADPAEVATKLATAQNQLQASYKIIADLEQLSLAKYL